MSSLVDNNYFGSGNTKNEAGSGSISARSSKEEPKEQNQVNLAVNGLKDGIQSLINALKDRTMLINGDLIEPLEMYLQHHDQKCVTQFDQAKLLLQQYYEKEENYAESKR